MRSKSVVVCFFLVGCLLFVWGAVEVVVAAEDLSKECADGFQKVTSCLNFATGKANAPTKECCDSAKDIKESNPKCLCFIIQQVHSGSDSVKNLGIQEAKLLQLPSACDLKNATVTDCPRLLGLDPKSADAAIFSGNSSSSVTPAAATTTPTNDANDSVRTKWGPSSLAGPLMIVLAMSVCSFPSEFASLF